MQEWAVIVSRGFWRVSDLEGVHVLGNWISRPVMIPYQQSDTHNMAPTVPPSTLR
jgi:hypothetical protein